MNRKILSGFTLALLVLNAAGLSLAGAPRKKVPAPPQTSQLVAKLPASDAVAVMDARRVFDDAMPRVLAAKPALLAKITAALNKAKAETGIDVRKFDHVAIGANFIKKSEKDFDVDFVALAEGSMNMGSLIAAAKLGTKGGYREEKFADHTIYIFSIKKIADKNLSAGTTATVSKSLSDMPDEMAVASLNTNTLVVGSPARVRETFEARSTIAPELVTLLSQRPGAVFAFAARVPDGVAGLLPMDNDELAKSIGSIEFVSGWGDVTPAGVSMNLTARTNNTESAQSLYDTVIFLQQFGKGFLGNSKKPENAVYARLIDNAKLAHSGTDITLDLTMAQSDINVLLAAVVKK